MAVIVTGMMMPKLCKGCKLHNTCWCNVTKETDFSHEEIAEIGVHNCCPLKSVEGLIEKIEQQKVISLFKGLSGAEEMKGMNDCIKIIKEYCGLEDDNDGE